MRAAFLLCVACAPVYDAREVVEAVEVGAVVLACGDAWEPPPGAVLTAYRCEADACESVPHELSHGALTLPACADGERFRVRYIAPAE